MSIVIAHLVLAGHEAHIVLVGRIWKITMVQRCRSTAHSRLSKTWWQLCRNERRAPCVLTTVHPKVKITRPTIANGHGHMTHLIKCTDNEVYIVSYVVYKWYNMHGLRYKTILSSSSSLFSKISAQEEAGMIWIWFYSSRVSHFMSSYWEIFVYQLLVPYFIHSEASHDTHSKHYACLHLCISQSISTPYTVQRSLQYAYASST